MTGIHRDECGCAYCVRTVLTLIKNSGPDPEARKAEMTELVRQQVDEPLDDAPDDWHGGREVTDGIKPYSGDCDHNHTTKYPTGKFCRDCGRWLN